MVDLSSIAPLVFASVPLVGSSWLLWRWLRLQPAEQRWLGFIGILPFLAVPLHWWFYPSDSVVAHLWFTAVQVLAFLFAVRVSAKYGYTSATVSASDQFCGVVAAGLAGVAAEIFPIGYFEHSGAFDDVAAGFIFNPPGWWWTISAFSWMLWFLVMAGMLASSVVIRRGWGIGYVGVALVVTLFARLKWLQYEDGPQSYGPYAPGMATVATVTVISAACWLIAAHRLVTGAFVAWKTRGSRRGLKT